MKRHDAVLCKNLLQQLMRHPDAWPFNEPVDPIRLEIPDYLDIIKHPMDFSTIMGKLDSKSYSSPGEFADDVQLVFSNCKEYNSDDSDIVAMAGRVQRHFEEQFLTLDIDWNAVIQSNTNSTLNLSDIGMDKPQRWRAEASLENYGPTVSGITRSPVQSPPKRVSLRQASRNAISLTSVELEADLMIQQLIEESEREDRTKTPKKRKREEPETPEFTDDFQPPVASSNDLSEYELQRLQNIQRNMEMMKELGLDTAKLMMPKKPTPPRPTTPREKKENDQPVVRRFSRRKKNYVLPPIFAAVRDRDGSAVTSLLQEDNNKELLSLKCEPEEQSVFHFAVEANDLEILKMLMDYDKTHLNDEDVNGFTPLDIAKQNYLVEAAKLLEEHGAIHSNKPMGRSLYKTITIWPTVPFSTLHEESRCNCCHLCKNSVISKGREYKACNNCSYVVCKTCWSSKLKTHDSWEEFAGQQSFVCDLCMGNCLCKKCITRGPPKWFGQMNPRWQDPATLEEEQHKYMEKVKKVQQEVYHLVDPPPIKIVQASPQLPCTCCHVCRRGNPKEFVPCTTCAYIVCKNCFVSGRLSQSWEDAENNPSWSCPVCNGVCSCSRCQKKAQNWSRAKVSM